MPLELLEQGSGDPLDPVPLAAAHSPSLRKLSSSSTARRPPNFNNSDSSAKDIDNMERLAIRRLMQVSGTRRITSSMRVSTVQVSHSDARFSSSTPTIAQTSFWKSLIPKPLRRSKEVTDPNAPKRVKSKEWNPATFFICIFLLIGSMSIQMISLKKNFEAYMRRSDLRIGLLREVVEKIQNGEEVDVERALGTGDREREAEWEEVLKEIERDDAIRNPRKQEKAKKSEAAPSNPKAEEPTQESPKTRSVASFF